MPSDFTADQIADLHADIAHADQAVTAIEEHLAEVEAQIAELEGHACSGTPTYTDKTYLYCAHRKNDTCPIHGRPKTRGRARVYIGNKPEKTRVAL